MEIAEVRTRTRTQVDLLQGNVIHALAVFALPFLISNIFQQLYNTVDTIIVGHNLGDASLAAIGASGPIYNLLVGLALGVGGGMSIVLGRKYGSSDRAELKKAVAATLVIGLAVSLLLTAVSLVAIMPLLRLLDTPMEIIDEAYSYISLITLFIVVMMGFNVLSGVLRAIGDSTMPLVFLAISAVANIGLDLLFIRGLQMGIRGAAIATVIAQGLSGLLCMIYILKTYPYLVPQKEHFGFDTGLYVDLLGQGISVGLMNALVNSGTLVMQYAINSLGYQAIAGYLAGKRLFFFTVMPLGALANSLSAFVAQNRGADQGLRIKQAVGYSHVFSVTWALFIAAFSYLTAPFLVKFLTGSHDVDVLAYGTTFIRIVTPFYLVLGPVFSLRHSLQGIGRKVIPLGSSIIELMGKVVFTLWIFKYTGYIGIVLCEPIIWCLMFAQLTWAFYTDPYMKAQSSPAS
ncbi:MAG: MATE family efflux transporter [Firmicutes bacterium]|nr:MATE family efflux transporter [Bacillota bacterium]